MCARNRMTLIGLAIMMGACGSGGLDLVPECLFCFPAAPITFTVDAGPDQTVMPGVEVVLAGRADHSQSLLKFNWIQIDGPAVEIASAGYAHAYFVAPFVESTTTLSFRLTATTTSTAIPVDSKSDDIIVTVTGGDRADVPAGTYSLNFESLPSSQGWTYLEDSLAENDAYSVDGVSLKQTTVSSGIDGMARYQMDNVASWSMPMTLSVTARILDYENLTGGSYGLGFNFLISDGTFLHRLALTADLIQVGGQFYGLNTTDFHDYRFELRPGGGFDLYVDGAIVATGNGLETIYRNQIFFGDNTPHENTDAEITSMSFTVGTN